MHWEADFFHNQEDPSSTNDDLQLQPKSAHVLDVHVHEWQKNIYAACRPFLLRPALLRSSSSRFQIKNHWPKVKERTAGAIPYLTFIPSSEL